MDNFVTLDLGQFRDFSALSVMARSLAVDAQGLPERDSRGNSIYSFQIVGLRRWPLKTEYGAVVKDLVRIATRSDIRPAPIVVIDMSGCGTAVFEQCVTAFAPYEHIRVYGINITGGATSAPRGRRMWNVAKVELVSALAEALGNRRVKICPMRNGKHQEHARLLKKELRDFKIRVSAKTGNTSAEAFNSDHDDCVMSVSLALWLGRQRWMAMTITADTTNLQPWEARALEVEKVAERKRELEQENDDDDELDPRFIPPYAVRHNPAAVGNLRDPSLWDED